MTWGLGARAGHTMQRAILKHAFRSLCFAVIFSLVFFALPGLISSESIATVFVAFLEPGMIAAHGIIMTLYGYFDIHTEGVLFISLSTIISGIFYYFLFLAMLRIISFLKNRRAG